MDITFKKPPAMATCMMVLGVFVLCTLGTWQVQRLVWKNGLLEKIEAAYAAENITRLKRPQDFQPLTRGAIFGNYLHSHEIAIGPRTHKGKPGYHILTPFALPGKNTILVNRGWVPVELKEAKSRKKSLVLGYIDVIGLVRAPEKPNMFTPENMPEDEQWYQVNLQQIAEHRNLDNLIPMIFYAEEETNPSGFEYPVTEAIQWKPKNNHLAYAFFWFTMAGALIAVFVLRFAVNDKKKA